MFYRGDSEKIQVATKMISGPWLFASSICLFVGIVYAWNIYIEQGKYADVKKYLLGILTVILFSEVRYMRNFLSENPHFLALGLLVLFRIYSAILDDHCFVG